MLKIDCFNVNAVPGIKFIHHMLSFFFLASYVSILVMKKSCWILFSINLAQDHFQSNMQLLWTLNLWILKKDKYYNDLHHRGLCLSKVAGNLAFKIAVSSPILPGETGL